jgi:CRISPR-associated endonuclease/helicase Cas3
MIDFTTLVRQATADPDAPDAAGHPPYPYQARLAEEGLPDLLDVPTGTGKTLAAVLPWLYRRRYHPDEAVRAATPRRLAVVLPQRALVEQTHRAVATWLGRLGLGGEVGLHLLLGGASSDDREWKTRPDQDCVVVGTQDMVLSRLLMRGYGEGRSAWPMSFGFLHADTQFVFDEVQLMGPGLPTSRQLEGLRRALGTAAPCHSMWMSATVDRTAFDTPDAPPLATAVGLGEADRSGPLRTRLTAVRTVGRLDAATDAKAYARDVAARVAGVHSPGTRTLVVLNTVARAVEVHTALTRLPHAPPTVLLHSRYRPGDRARQLDRALAAVDADGPGLVVVTTQVLEAGIDVTSALLVTELAPWSSLVQRAGRCNRGGEHADARLLWVDPPAGRAAAAPYADADLAATREALVRLDGRAMTSSQLSDLAAEVDQDRPVHPVIRLRDMLDLFDTMPDLTGDDLDVSRWIRDSDERTLSVAWRPVPDGHPEDDAPALRREELCPVPVGELRDFLAKAQDSRAGRAWVRVQPGGTWERVRPADHLRPGGLVLLDLEIGGYLTDQGWSGAARAPVPEVATDPVPDRGAAGADDGDGMGADPRSLAGRPVLLAQHGVDVRDETAALLRAAGPLPGLAAGLVEAAALAGLLHDIGKAHPAFVAALRRAGAPDDGGPWAKSGGTGRLRHEPRYFRHELVSALMVLHPDSGLLAGQGEPDLVAYLVAAHHGKVRLAVRALPDEHDTVLGVGAGDETPPVTLPDGRAVPALTLDRDLLQVGGGDSGVSWTTRACGLRDRADLGPFRLAYLEAVVRAADWRASARYDAPDAATAAVPTDRSLS